MRTKLLFTTMLLFFMVLAAYSQTSALDPASKRTFIVGPEKIPVTVFAKAPSFDDKSGVSITPTGIITYAKPTLEYFYMPCNLRLGTTKDGKPEFLFLSYASDNKADISGAIMNSLVEWGLTKPQTDDLEKQLKKAVPGAKLLGAANVIGDDNPFSIVSATIDKPITSGKAPTMPGGKFGIAARMDNYNAQLFQYTLDKGTSIADMSVFLYFKYYVKMPALKGKITVKWKEIYEKEAKDSVANADKTVRRRFFLSHFTSVVGTTRTELRSYYDELVQNKLIDVQLEDYSQEAGDKVYESSEQVRKAFFDVFLQNVASPDKDEATLKPERGMDSLNVDPDRRRYTLFRQTSMNMKSRKNETYKLNYSVVVPRTMYTSANVKSWFNAAKFNKECVPDPIPLIDSKVRNVVFGVDQDIIDLFASKELSSVSVNFKVDRTTNPFSVPLRFSETATEPQKVNYASFKDGDTKYVYNVAFKIRNEPEVVTNYTAPQEKGVPELSLNNIGLQRADINFNISPADKDSLLHMNIYKCFYQVRYKRLGKEVETVLVLDLTKDSNESIKSIIKDIGTKHAGRIVYNTPKNYTATDWVIDAVGDQRAFVPDGFVARMVDLAANYNKAKLQNAASNAVQVVKDVASQILDDIIKN